jgi:NAD(P)-dependent dehydrogenase (short-subunit alcohol dehydrogenase family)
MGSTAEHGGGALIYRSSKAALNNVVKGLSIAFKNDGLILVAVHPGWVRTDMGGQSATLAPEQSILAMRKLVGGLNRGDSGRYFNYDGAEIPW